MTKKCNNCKTEKEESDFHKRKRNRGTYLQSVCKICRKQMDRDRYLNSNKRDVNNIFKDKLRQFSYDYLKCHPCVDCGESDPIVLEFDHKQDSHKLGDVSSMIGHRRSLKKIKEEIEKCEVRCSNCHKRKTAKQQGWYKGLKL